MEVGVIALLSIFLLRLWVMFQLTDFGEGDDGDDSGEEGGRSFSPMNLGNPGSLPGRESTRSRSPVNVPLSPQVLKTSDRVAEMVPTLHIRTQRLMEEGRQAAPSSPASAAEKSGDVWGNSAGHLLGTQRVGGEARRESGEERGELRPSPVREAKALFRPPRPETAARRGGAGQDDVDAMSDDGWGFERRSVDLGVKAEEEDEDIVIITSRRESERAEESARPDPGTAGSSGVRRPTTPPRSGIPESTAERETTPPQQQRRFRHRVLKKRGTSSKNSD
jgi:hypothetical protein